MTRGLAPLLILAILGALVLAVYQGVWWMTAPVSSPSAQPPPRIVLIPEGATLRQVAILLEQAGLIRNRGSFLTLGKIASADRRILAGEYELHAAMRPAEILSRIRNGQVVLHAVTIPEGYTFLQIAELLRQKGLSDPDEFLRLARDKQFIQSLNLDVATLEGYLFPDTYRFARNAKAKDVITTMVTGLWEAFTPELRERAKEVNMNVHEVLTLASVIEKETSVDSERDLISAVFHNRLRRKIPLQSDPTVIYGLDSFDGNLRKRDLDVRSPYNTYRVKGLPPGPIANPGLHSIRAALYPIRAKYLYFVSRNDGTHHFSSTLDEHNRAVDKYQRRPARRVSVGCPKRCTQRHPVPSSRMSLLPNNLLK